MAIQITPEQDEAFRKFAGWPGRFKPAPSDYSLTVMKRPDGFAEAMKMAQAAVEQESAEDAASRKRVRLKPNGKRFVGFGVFRKD